MGDKGRMWISKINKAESQWAGGGKLMEKIICLLVILGIFHDIPFRKIGRTVREDVQMVKDSVGSMKI